VEAVIAAIVVVVVWQVNDDVNVAVGVVGNFQVAGFFSASAMRGSVWRRAISRHFAPGLMDGDV